MFEVENDIINAILFFLFFLKKKYKCLEKFKNKSKKKKKPLLYTTWPISKQYLHNFENVNNY